MRNDAERRFNEVVAGMMSQGWIIDCSRGFNQGHQGEINRVVLTKGSEVKVVWMTEEANWKEDKTEIFLEVKAYRDLRPCDNTVWYNAGEVELTEKFLKVSSQSMRTNLYVVAEGTEADEMLNKQISRRRHNYHNIRIPKPNLINRANEILRNSGIRGTKSDKVITVWNVRGRYIFATEKRNQYILDNRGFRAF